MNDNAWEYLSDAEYYSRFDPYWDSTLDWIFMLPEVGEKI